MKKQQMTQVIFKAFEANCSSVLVTGKWGVGKSTAIGEYLDEIGSDYIRISALGIDSSEKFSNRVGIEALSRRYAFFPMASKIESVRKVAGSSSKTKEFSDFGWNTLTLIGNKVAEGKIIWLDDIERANENLVPILLGELQNLVEAYKCKVIIAANESFLDVSKPWHALIEKVISAHINFDRDIDEIVDVAFEANEKLTYLRESVAALQVYNIRAIYRIISYYKIITRDGSIEMSENINQQISMTVALGVLSKYSVNPKIPTLTELMNWKIQYFPKESKGDLLQTQNNYLSEIGYTETDELDAEILRFVMTGDFDDEKIDQCIRDTNNKIRLNQAREAYHNVWKKVHQTFTDNLTELSLQFRDVLNEYSDVYGPREYNEVLSLYKSLADSSFAADFISNLPRKFTIRSNRRDYFEGIGNPYEYEPEISDLITFESDTEEVKSIFDILKAIIGRNGWNSADEVILANTPLEKYVEFIESTQIEHLPSYINRLFDFGKLSDPSDIQRAIARNTATALQSIKEKNQLNSFRLRKWKSDISRYGAFE
jgi:hypothetical protein